MEQIKIKSPNYYSVGGPIRAIVLHGTAGSWGASLSTLLNPRIDNPKAAVSANYLIDYSGKVAELVDWRSGKRAWANGIIRNPDYSLEWLRRAIAGGINPNLLTISIEHVATRLQMENHSSMPDAQFNSSTELVVTILRELKLPISNQTVTGHYQFDSVNKPFCPGVINVPAYIEVLKLRKDWYM